MKSSLWVRLLLLSLALGCLFAGRSILPRTVELRDAHHLVSTPASEGAPPEYVLTSALLGGFRGMFLTGLWMRGQTLKNDGKFFEMVQTYNIITKLEPNYANAWAFAAWDLSFNVSVEFKDNLEDRVFWVYRGVDMLRKQGIPLNKNVPELYYELAWIFNFKIGQDTDYAHPLYRQRLAQEMHILFLGAGSNDPELFRAITTLPETEAAFLRDPLLQKASERLKGFSYSLPKDARQLLFQPPTETMEVMDDPLMQEAARKSVIWDVGKRLRTDYFMDPAVMLQLMEKFESLDWRLPHAHSLYWAHMAHEIWLSQKPKHYTLKYERLVYFSLIRLVERGKFVATQDGRVFGVPDYRYLDGVVQHMDETMAFYADKKSKTGNSVSLVGMRSGYVNFLRSAIFQAYFDGRIAQAKKLLAKVYQVSKKDRKYNVTLNEFVKNEFDEWIQSPTKDRSMALLDAFLLRGYWHLGLGDRKNYDYQNKWADYFHKRYMLRRWNPNEYERAGDTDYSKHVPRDLSVLRKAALVRILMGQVPNWGQVQVNRLAAELQVIDPQLWQSVIEEMQSQQDRMMKRQRLRGTPDAAPAP